MTIGKLLLRYAFLLFRLFQSFGQHLGVAVLLNGVSHLLLASFARRYFGAKVADASRSL
jgi:uncharacterized membrane protein (DUF485 family)